METLVYLAQGRSAPYIADEQFLSVNTVRTHIKRIYAKMDVHSKEELLDLFHKS
ncbi:helix-turn-helix transcriptional regulator [Eggerthella sp.]|uniref:response regulator transcription factor n=1 Tax=Eggerthella sp. TaxID=1929886 RepID=UPI00284684D3|nr:helix-turn-helix transcriptional regulator [Eggerthella sp.]MDR3849394.1 helix-turn-helix transcriptional regulator [Eggerthella sp.]